MTTRFSNGPQPGRVARQQQARDLRRKGASFAEIAKSLGVSLNTAKNLAEKYPESDCKKLIQYNGAKTDEAQRLAAEYGDGATLQELGQKYGVTAECIRQRLARIGVTGMAIGKKKTYPESRVEAYLTKCVKALGGVAYKFVSPAQRGVADRVVCLPDGSTWFVELKAPNGRLSPLQQVFANEMRRMRQSYACLWSKEHVDDWIKECGYEPSTLSRVCR